MQSPALESLPPPKDVRSQKNEDDSKAPRPSTVSQVHSQAIEDLSETSSGGNRAPSSYSSSKTEGSKQKADLSSDSSLLSLESTVLKPRVNVQELERQASAQSLEIIDEPEQQRHDQRHLSQSYLGQRVAYRNLDGERAKCVGFEDSMKRANDKRSPYAFSDDESWHESGWRHGYSSDTTNNRRVIQDSFGGPERPRLENDGCPGSRRRAITVSERVDGNLGRRRDQQFARPYSMCDVQGYREREKSPGVSSNTNLPVSAPLSPTQGARYDSKPSPSHCYSPTKQSSKYESPVPKTPSYSVVRVTSPRRGRTVSFSDEEAQKRASSQRTSEPRWSRQSSPTKEPAGRTSPDPSSLCLLPCPRSIPTAGHQDWYTIIGMSYIDICPSCMKQIGQSRFRDYFIPSLPKPRGQKVRCALSEPWTRLAWLQTIKQRHTNLEMLYQITRPPAGSMPCPGRTSSVQAWYKVIDPETGTGLPKFNVCSACVRNVRILMPPLRDAFKCSPVMQERVCDLSSESPRFVQYLDLLDAAANRCEYERLPAPDMRDFVNYARRKCMLRNCRRDRMILSTWHYIPDLPEFTICEDCYDDVVWPLAKAGKPIAKMVSPVLRLLPGYGPDRCREASCQLYSPRMRTRFREAVLSNDYKYLKLAALRRFEAENRYRERKQLLLEDERRGYDRDLELRKNAEEWKKWE